MLLGLLPLIAAIALTGVYVFVTEESRWWKGLVVGLLLVSLLWRYGMFLQVAISIGLSLYFTYLKARCLSAGVGEAGVFHHAADEREVVGEFAGFEVAAREIRLNRSWWRERFAS